MMQTRSAHQLAPRHHRAALAAGGLLLALVVLVFGTGRAIAHPASAPTPTTVAPARAPVGPAPPSAPVVAGQEASVEIPSLGISLPVVLGGQDVIDRGVAAHYTGAQWRPPTDPGQAGTYWLAAHNATHGSPFATLSAIADGAEVRIITLEGTVFTYGVTSVEVVGTSTTLATVYGPDSTTPRLLLQTCQGASQRVLVHGVLTSVTSV